MTVLLKRTNPASPWIDSEIMELCLLKNRLQKKCRANPSDNLLKEEYRITRNKITAKIRLAKRRYQLGQFSSCRRNIKKTWDLVKNIAGRHPKRNVDTNLRESFPSIGCYDLANKFNEHFINAVNELKNKIAHPDSLQSPSSCVFSAYMPDVTEVELWQVMRTMPLTKPPGFDRVRLRDLIFNFLSSKKCITAYYKSDSKHRHNPERLENRRCQTST